MASAKKIYKNMFWPGQDRCRDPRLIMRMKRSKNEQFVMSKTLDIRGQFGLSMPVVYEKVQLAKATKLVENSSERRVGPDIRSQVIIIIAKGRKREEASFMAS